MRIIPNHEVVWGEGREFLEGAGATWGGGGEGRVMCGCEGACAAVAGAFLVVASVEVEC